MRQDVIEALQRAEQERTKTEQWLRQEGLWPLHSADVHERAAGDYSTLLTDQQYNNRERVHWKLIQLQHCLQQKKYLGARDIYQGSVTTLVLEWGELETEVEIELSRYGNLAAVFVHGDIALSVSANKDINDCLEAGGLLRLTEEEVAELNEQGIHYDIF
jgi:hypothetical protein